jgi:lipopolysaccharide heptosyltransferase II
LNAMNWEQARRILCVRLDSLGDVLMTTPAMRAIKEGLPGRKITLLTSPSGAAAARLIPEVDHTIVYEAPWMKATALRPNPQEDHAMIKRLRRGRYDAAVIFTVFSQNPLPAALMAYLADIPLRLAHCRENPYQLLTDWIPDPAPLRPQDIVHEARRQLDLVAKVGYSTADERLSVSTTPAAARRVEKLLNAANLDRGAPWVVIHAGATAPSRRYPPLRFAQAAACLVKEHGWQVVFTGSSGEIPLVESIQMQMGAPSISVAGSLSLGELAALLEAAPLLISNNTGPVHMAAAVGTPVVDIYALTNPQHTPWQVPHKVLSFDVPCKFCYKSICPLGHNDCLTQIEPGQVVEAALDLMRTTEMR